MGDMLVTDPNAELLWSYGAGHECQPDGYQLQLATDSGFTSIFAYGGTGAFDTSWDTPPLPPDTEFWWRVAGGVDDGAGGLYLGPWSVSAQFHTESTVQVCAPGVGMPELVWPTNGETIHSTMPLLDWEWPLDCLPEGYRVDLYEDVEPASDLLSGATGSPDTSWFPGDDLLDCTTYRWFVSPVVDEMLGTASAERGFFVDVSGMCSSAGGMVWHDECALPEHGPFPINPPPGCIDDGVGYYIANGVIDPGETGIGGVTVNLGAGACPSTGLDTAVTNASGNYNFGHLADGTYCISASSLADGNGEVLIPGGWSYPAASESIVKQEIVVAGGTAPDANFGWDWQFLPEPRTSGIVGTVWHDECAVPFDYDPGDPIPEGCIDVGGGALGADGIFDGHEVGIPGVTLKLGHGSCPSTGAYSATTDANGVYEFPGLLDGTYCVSVDSLAHGNDGVLIPGSWTFPNRDVNPQKVEFNIEVPPEGVDVGLPIQNFGWDYQFLPLADDEVLGYTKREAYCRTGASPHFPVQWVLPDDKRLLIEGRDYHSEWLKVLPDGKGAWCWIAAFDVELPLPINELPILWEPELLDGTISGWAYYDLNGNGVRDEGDEPFCEAKIILKPGSCPGSGEARIAWSNTEGYYVFHDVDPGSYCVLRHESQPWLTPAYQNVTVQSGMHKSNVNFRKVLH
jgi:hypothetical protein